MSVSQLDSKMRFTALREKDTWGNIGKTSNVTAISDTHASRDNFSRYTRPSDHFHVMKELVLNPAMKRQVGADPRPDVPIPDTTICATLPVHAFSDTSM